MARKAWSDLSPAYKKRLQAQGITAKSHRSADLNPARGHVSTKPVGAIDRATIERVLRGEGTRAEVTGKSLLSRFTWPAWVPREVHNQQNGVTYQTEPAVGAALSQLPDPRTWKSVTFIPELDGPWTMVVEIKRRKRPKRIQIPGGGEPGSGAKQVLDIVTQKVDMSEDYARRQKIRAIEALFMDVTGTDEEAA